MTYDKNFRLSPGGSSNGCITPIRNEFKKKSYGDDINYGKRLLENTSLNESDIRGVFT